MRILCALGLHWMKEMTGGTRNGVRLIFWSRCRWGCGRQRMRKGRP